MSPGARVIAGYMARLPSFPDAFFALAQLAEVTGRGAVQNRRYLRELEAEALLSRAAHVDPRYGQRSNDYAAILPDGMIGGAISEDRAFLRLRHDPPADARPRAEPPPKPAPSAPRPRPVPTGAALARIEPPVAPPPALLAAVLREHGLEVEAVVLGVLGTPEARAHPAAALEALDALTTYGRADVRTTVGRLFRWLVREAIAGRVQRNVLTSGPRANTPAARIVRAIEDAEQLGRTDEAKRLRDMAFRAGRAAAERIDRLELEDPAHQRAQALIDAARRGALPSLPPPPCRAPRDQGRRVAGYLLARFGADGPLVPRGTNAHALPADAPRVARE